ncbi:YbgA family protein [Vibrio profundi]|uniref:YbgA family protein n=1 Tax=Vibrio profundi TaxID=1774960 RepID=UPI0037356A5B
MKEHEIRVGVSACVVGEKVRFDSGHKQSNFVTKELTKVFSLIPICPEVGIGMSVPRPTIRLISNEERIALVETKDPTKDYTEQMLSYSRDKAKELINKELCGYIVCAKSPTCGMERVKIYAHSQATKSGVGLYTQELQKAMPWLPIEEDGRLNDPVLKENFIARVYCLKDFYDSMEDAPSPGKIVAFHSRYKLTLMAHHPESYKKMGKLVANVKQYEPQEFFQLYRLALMEAISHKATRKNNTNTLMHIQGYFKRALDQVEKQELSKLIDDYRVGVLPLLAPLTLINHYLKKYPDSYLAQQRYLEPYPEELRLRYGL